VGLAITELKSAPRLRVSHNDIVGSTVRAVAAPKGWSQSLPLCDESCAEGNHWGSECPEAFRPLPPPPRACTGDPARSCDEDATCLEAAAGVCATTDADAPNDLIFDPRPYGEPIAAATSAAPSPCP